MGESSLYVGVRIVLLWEEVGRRLRFCHELDSEEEEAKEQQHEVANSLDDAEAEIEDGDVDMERET